jgi:hypothetical protein
LVSRSTLEFLALIDSTRAKGTRQGCSFSIDFEPHYAASKGIPMRKGRRFTPARLERWRRNGRGTGTGSNYIPWHQVTRDDPSSRGRSHTVPWRFKRLHHLLSDQELIAFGFATMLPDVHDLREQFPLAHDDHQQEITAYTTAPLGSAAGTATIANELGCKHPLVYGNGECAPWILSTDLLLTLGGSSVSAWPRHLEATGVMREHRDHVGDLVGGFGEGHRGGSAMARCRCRDHDHGASGGNCLCAFTRGGVAVLRGLAAATDGAATRRAGCSTASASA